MQMERGFTLVELLVVIAIVSVLSVVVIITLNPAELLRQTRDSNRISDLTNLRSALSLYLVDVASPAMGSTSLCYVSAPDTVTTITPYCGGRHAASTRTTTQVTVTNLRKVTNEGWIPVKLTDISSGSPLGSLPVDPVNDATYFYSYAATSSFNFELGAKMESARYKNGGAGDVESKDGGDTPTIYETGSAPGLEL